MPTHRGAPDLFAAASEAARAASRSFGPGPASAVLFWGSPPETEVVPGAGVPEDVARALAAAGGRCLAAAVRRHGHAVRIRVSDLPKEADGLAASLRRHDLPLVVLLPLHGERGIHGCLVLPREEAVVRKPADRRWREAGRMLSAHQVAAGAAALRYALGEGGVPPLAFDGVVVVDRRDRVLLADGLVLDVGGWDGAGPFGRALGQLPGGTILSTLKVGVPGEPDWVKHILPPLVGSGMPVELAAMPTRLEEGSDSGGRIVFVRDLRVDRPSGTDSSARQVALALRVAHSAAELAEALPAALGLREESVVPRALLEAARTVPMLARAVLERGLGREGMARCDLNRTTSETLERVRAELEGSRVSVFSFLGPKLDVAPTDRLELSQVLRTLTGKARRSLRATGGTLTVRTWSEEGFACVAISDDGVGVGLGNAPHGFHPLFADEQDGLDVELDAVRAVVEGWGGRFLVEQRPGLWNRYTLMLREAGGRPEVVAPRAPEVAGAEREAGLHVLVVDDDAALRSVVRRYLERRGHEVTEAADGEQALGLCGGRRFDRVIVDVCMPNKTGPEFYSGLGSVAPSLRERTFFMTGGALEPRDLRSVLESGRPAIMKPFELSELARTVEAGA